MIDGDDAAVRGREWGSGYLDDDGDGEVYGVDVDVAHLAHCHDMVMAAMMVTMMMLMCLGRRDEGKWC